MTDRMRVSTICSIRTHMQTRKRPARNCTFLVTGGGLQAERAHYGTSSAAAVTFQPEDRDASDGGHVYEHYGDLAWPCRRFRHGSGASERHSRPCRFWRSAVNQNQTLLGDLSMSAKCQSGHFAKSTGCPLFPRRRIRGGSKLMFGPHDRR